MCRHLAWIGEPVTLRQAVIDPPFGLYRQAWAPRLQRHGTVNADGFGVGWYAQGDPVPARYRRAGPMWADESFADVARVTRTHSLMAAVRSATANTEPGVAAAAPYGTGPWLFSHNGAVPDWEHELSGFADRLPASELLALPARCDAAVLWALVLHRLRAGDEPAAALGAVVHEVGTRTRGRLNLMLTDGVSIVASTWGDTLFYRSLPGRGTTVASEPDDDESDWVRVPDRSLVVATALGTHVAPLTATPDRLHSAHEAWSSSREDRT